jgi:hypothetical protein
VNEKGTLIEKNVSSSRLDPLMTVKPLAPCRQDDVLTAVPDVAPPIVSPAIVIVTNVLALMEVGEVRVITMAVAVGALQVAVLEVPLMDTSGGDVPAKNPDG